VQDIIHIDEAGLASKSVAPVCAGRAYDNPLVSQSLEHGLEIACFRQIETRGNAFGRNPLVPRMDRDISHDCNRQYLSTRKERQSGAPAGRRGVEHKSTQRGIRVPIGRLERLPRRGKLRFGVLSARMCLTTPRHLAGL